MKGTNIIGFLISLVGAVLGIAVTLIVFSISYIPLQAAEAVSPLLGAEGCVLAVKYILPFISDLGVLGGTLFAVSAIGFLQDKKWAFPLSVLASVVALQGSFWPMIPAMATGNPPLWIIIFMPEIIIYFLLMNFVGKLPMKVTILGLLTGMAYVLAFMNGVASYNRIIVVGLPIFVAVQRLNWVSSFGWGVVTVGLLLNSRHKEGLRMVGMTCAILEGVAGITAAIFSPMVGFSLFLLGPIMSLTVLPIVASSNLWGRFFNKDVEKK